MPTGRDQCWRYRWRGLGKRGFAYDLHTLSSQYMGVGQHGHDNWDTTRTEMGQLVNDLKFRGKRGNVEKIVELLVTKFGSFASIDIIIPVPPSRSRALQPVPAIATAPGRQVKVPVAHDLLIRTPGPELKGIDDREIRRQLLKESMQVGTKFNLKQKRVLLLDDVYRSGATLAAAAQLLNQAGAEEIFALTMTKTRSSR